MAIQDPIWDRAKRDLVFTDHCGIEDVFLWEHSQRVARTARYIATLPEVSARRIDRAALEAAALYHDAGWVRQLSDGTVHRSEVLSRPTSDVQRELAIALLSDALRDHLSPRSLEIAGGAVRQINNRHVRAVEAQILGDADNLDAVGTLSLWNLIRRHTFEGKGVEATLQTWQRQREFRFWEARINKSIRFEAVRRIAFERLEQLDEFMSVLARHRAGNDVLERVPRSAPPAP